MIGIEHVTAFKQVRMLSKIVLQIATTTIEYVSRNVWDKIFYTFKNDDIFIATGHTYNCDQTNVATMARDN